FRSSSNAWVSSPSKLTHLRNRAGMIRSVSMSWPRSGLQRPEISLIKRWVVMLCVHLIGLQNRPHVHHFAGNRGGGHHGGTHEQGPAGGTALAPFDVRVRGRGANLPSLQLIGIHREAHRAPGASPLESGRGED